MPRRRFQQGCLKIVGYQWVLYYWQDEIRDGERVRVKVSKRLGTIEMSKRAARKLAQPILDYVNNQPEGNIPVRDMNKSITLTEFIPEWRKHAATSLKPSSLKSMESSIRAHLLPMFGKTPLSSLDTKKFQELVTSMNGRTLATKKNVVDDFDRILKAAAKWHQRIPTITKKDLYFGKPKLGEGKPFFFTVKQVKLILKAFEGRKTWDAFFTLLALSGLRAGEITGLRVEDLDFENNLIHIRQSAWEGKIQTVKTKKSENSIPMTSLVKAKLQRHLNGHVHELVFPNRHSRPYTSSKINERVLHPVLKRIGIKHEGRRCGTHAFRHTVASMLLQASGVLVAQRQLRHSDYSTTVERYGHILGDDQRLAMEQVQSVLLN